MALRRHCTLDWLVRPEAVCFRSNLDEEGLVPLYNRPLVDLLLLSLRGEASRRSSQ